MLILLVLTVNISAQDLPEDGQIWTSVQFVIGLKKGKDAKGREIDKFALLLEGIDRFGDNASRPVDQRVAAFVEYRAANFFRLTGGYLYQKSAPLKTGQNYESRLSIAGTFDRRLGIFNLRTRQMVERKFRNSRADTTNYRPSFQASFPVRSGETELFSPFVNNESYYDTLSKSWTRNEFRAGLTRKLTNRLAADFYYIRVDTRPLNINGFGVHLKVKLR